jgi:hypothetical protein
VEGIEVRLVVDQHADGVTVRVADSTHDLSAVPGFTPPPQGRVLVTPEVVVTRVLTLCVMARTAVVTDVTWGV